MSIPVAIASLACIALVVALLYFLTRRSDKDGRWHEGDHLQMRRWNGHSWETRPMTDDEISEYADSAAW